MVGGKRTSTALAVAYGTPETTDQSLQREALALIASTRLDKLLKESFGDCALVGSAALDLMSWRDIDLYVPVERSNAQLIAVLPAIYAAFTSAAFTVVRTTFNDEWAVPRGDYDSGYYWGFRIGAPAKTAWKIDLWGWDRSTFKQKIEEHRQLEQSLAAADRQLILKLKRQAQELLGFRSEITSWDIYQFVLSGHGNTLKELCSFCLARTATARRTQGPQCIGTAPRIPALSERLGRVALSPSLVPLSYLKRCPQQEGGRFAVAH